MRPAAKNQFFIILRYISITKDGMIFRKEKKKSDAGGAVPSSPFLYCPQLFSYQLIRSKPSEKVRKHARRVAQCGSKQN